MDSITTYVIVVAPGEPPLYRRLDADGSPKPLTPARVPPKVRRCGLSLHAWANGQPLPPDGTLAPDLLKALPRGFPLRLAVVVGGSGPAELQ